VMAVRPTKVTAKVRTNDAIRPRIVPISRPKLRWFAGWDVAVSALNSLPV